MTLKHPLGKKYLSILNKNFNLYDILFTEDSRSYTLYKSTQREPSVNRDELKHHINVFQRSG